MKKLLILVLCMVFLLSACSRSGMPEQAAEAAAEEPADIPAAAEEEEPEPDYSGYPIRIYSDSVTAESMNWLLLEAKEAGFTIRINDGSTLSDDLSLLGNADENMDGDLIFGLNGMRWTELLNGEYENLSVAEWTPSWAEEVGDYQLDRRAYGLVLPRSLMLYRADESGTDGKELHFEHWADVLDSGYHWNHPDTADANALFSLNAAMLFPYIDPNSPAGGISAEGWKTLWKIYADGVFPKDDEPADPLNLDGVQVAFCSSSALSSPSAASPKIQGYPPSDIVIPESWSLVEIDDGSFDTPEYIGILEKAGRTADETAAVLSFAEWFGSAEVQADWAEYFGGFPCNRVACELLYGNEIPAPYSFHNLALDEVWNNQNYAAYAIEHAAEWNKILDKFGFFPADADGRVSGEPDWENIDWTELT